MTTITEDYVSFETAKLLKKKGFMDGAITKFFASGYDSKGNILSIRDTELKDYPRPTLQMACKWLREVHNKNIILDMLPEDNDCYVLWTFNVLSNNNYKIMWGTKQPKYNTYEGACEAAIKYCLENLI